METWKSWTLTDAERGIWVDHFSMCAGEFDIPAEPFWAIKKRTLRGGSADGVDLIEIDNGALTLSILPTRGMGIWRGRYRNLDIGWQSPVRGPVHPSLINLMDQGGLGWLAGFDETIVRCGLASNGAPGRDAVPSNTGAPVDVDLTLHGKIANIPARRVEVRLVSGEQPELVVLGEVYETGLYQPQLRLATRISTRCGSNTFTIRDEVTNLRAIDAECELLYHCNFGPPFLEQGARLDVPARTVTPRDARAAEDIDTYAVYLGPTAGYAEQCYWFEPAADGGGNTLAMLSNAAANKGVVIRYNVNELPALTQWKNTSSERDGYVTGLEPGTDYPNLRTFERQQGRVVKLSPGQTYTATVTTEVHDSAAGVAAVQAEIARLQGETPPAVRTQPDPRLTPA